MRFPHGKDSCPARLESAVGLRCSIGMGRNDEIREAGFDEGGGGDEDVEYGGLGYCCKKGLSN